MTSFVFKIIAMLTMVCDHTGSLLFDDNLYMRCIGRCAFLIYAFLMAEGYRHLKDRPQRITYHLQKLMLLVALTEIPYDYVESGVWDEPESQTAAFTLLLGFGALALADRYRENKKTQLAIYLSAAAASYFIRSNYKFAGVLLIVAFYYYLERAESMTLAQRMGALLAIMLAYWPIYLWAFANFGNFAAFVDAAKSLAPWFVTHLLMVVPFALYNGKLGHRDKVFDFVYNWFYPLHFVALGLIRFFFMG